MHAWLWALQHLYRRGARTFTAAAGIAFAVLLIFLEMGFLRGVDRTATLLFDQLRFELLLTSSEYEDLSRTALFPRQRLAQALAAPGVAAVVPLQLGFADWRLPARRGLLVTVEGGQLSSIAVLALPPESIPDAFHCGSDGVFPHQADAHQAAAILSRRGAFLFDRRSKPEYGSADFWIQQTHSSHPDQPALLNGRTAVIAGSFDLGTGFCWNALLLTADTSFADYLPQPADGIHFGLVQLQPQADPHQVQLLLQTILPNDVRVWTRSEIAAAERRYWVQLTSVGQFLLVAVALVVLVGVIFVYQMMAADIRSMLPEYATVKAIGHAPSYAAAMVLWQAGMLASLGFLPGWAAASLAYDLSRRYGGIPAEMTPLIIGTTAVLTIGMCLLSALMALRKVRSADPADLF